MHLCEFPPKTYAALHRQKRCSVLGFPRSSLLIGYLVSWPIKKQRSNNCLKGCLFLEIVLLVCHQLKIVNSDLFVHNCKKIIWEIIAGKLVLYVSQSKCAFYRRPFEITDSGAFWETQRRGLQDGVVFQHNPVCTMTWQIIIKIHDIRAVRTGRCRVTATRTTNSSMQPRSLVYQARL